MMARILLPLLLLSACRLLPLGCQTRNDNETHPGAEQVTGTPVEIVIVTAVDITNHVNAAGVVHALYDAQVSAETSGRVEAVIHDVGGRVGMNDAVIRLDPSLQELSLRQAEARLRIAEAALRKAETDLGRMERLFAARDISENEIEQAGLLAEQAAGEHKLADASLGLAKRAFEDTWIRAPFAGVVTAVHINVGEMISLGQPAFNIVQIDTVTIGVDIPAKDIGMVRKTQPAEISVRPFPDTCFHGEVGKVSIKANHETRTYSVEVISDNHDHLLKPGMLADVRIVTGREDDVIAVPLDAVLQRKGESVAFVEQDGIAIERKLQVASRRADQAIIAGGLSVGDRLITAGQHALEDGRRVIITD